MTTLPDPTAALDSRPMDHANPPPETTGEHRTREIPAVVPSRLTHLGRNLGYNLAALFIGVISFSVAITLFSAGLGTVLIYIGVFVLVGALFTASFFAAGERALARWTSGPLPPTYYRSAPTGSALRRMLSPLADVQRWKDLIHAVVSFPVRILAFSVTVTWIAGALGGLTQWFWYRFIPEPKNDIWDILGIDPVWHPWIQIGVGIILLVTLFPVSRGLALLQRALAIGLLTNERQALREETTRLTSSRSQVIAAEAGTLRRIERDIHDGPQQRLVRMAMDLEAAKRRIDPQDQPTRELIDAALSHSKDALSELRALSRGIAPPILTDRGLVAAFEAAAATSPLPVRLTIHPGAGRRFPATIEQAAYFSGVEALTNAAKHSAAAQCTLALATDGSVLTLTVHDDGVGGAHPGKGSGLAGLRDRLAGVDGTLEVDSPEGGGTTVTAMIPLHT
ncbi:sensor histidine kinase [Arthrobacter sp. JSM 101049]|uniref:sensor histidine kinase n=1 Tax=Arthrobacter sp. JSM 101049 TaxID=929097 RepID=UPI003564C60A